ncbi:hypothetical protein D9V87_09050 [Bacteroidetes/Chlorobi group bacterium MS-B_bin-24]|jgi:nitrite reductase/ring-hydroxylating ferredoxin subunit|nr:MAG: hypothetical protein D9V87_09050 [Bacteroidetes/Chlorobi group bacterium MS-B_bin-24]
MEGRMKENNTKKVQSRREFLRYAGSFFISGLVVSSIYPILTSCEKDESLPPPPRGSSITIDLSEHPELKQIPSISKLSFQKPVSLTIIIKRTSKSEFVVFSAFCPHQGVELEVPSNPDGNIRCPKHFAEFSTSLSTAGFLVANPQGVKVGNLSTYHYEFDAAKNILTIKLS